MSRTHNDITPEVLERRVNDIKLEVLERRILALEKQLSAITQQGDDCKVTGVVDDECPDVSLHPD